MEVIQMKSNTQTDVRTNVWTVDNIEETKKKVNELATEGYTKDSIYVLTHDKDRTERVAENTDTEQITILEEGLGTSIANIFRSEGDELRAKMRSMGISKSDAERLEAELDKDKIVVIAWSGVTYTGEDYDSSIGYYPPYVV
jgi:hypothetical protein